MVKSLRPSDSSSSRNGERHNENGATAGRIAVNDLASLGTGQRLRQDQAKTQSCRRVLAFTSREGAKKIASNFCRQPRAVIGNGKYQSPGRLSGRVLQAERDADGAVPGRAGVFLRVVEKVLEYFADGITVEAHRGQPIGNRQFDNGSRRLECGTLTRH